MEILGGLSKSRTRSIYFLVFIVPFLMGLGVDLYVPSLPSIVNYFNTDASLVQLTVSLYMLGYGVGQVVLGILSDSFGRRKILLLSALCFSIMSCACIITPNILILEISRLFQGICVAGLAVVARAMIPDVFSGVKLAKATNYFTLSWSLGPIIAPFIGGNLADKFGWKSNFYLFAIYGIFIFIYSYMKFEETNTNLVPLSFYTVRKSLKEIICSPLFMIISTLSALGYGTIVLFNAVGPFLIEVLLKYTVKQYGMIAMILGCAYCFGATTNRLVINKFNSKSLLKFGIFTSFISSLILLVSSIIFKLNLYAIMIPVFMIFFFIGFIVPNALALTMSLFSEIAGTASSVFGTVTGIVVFIVTIFGSNLKSDSQIPLTLVYISLFILEIILFYVAKKYEVKHKL